MSFLSSETKLCFSCWWDGQICMINFMRPKPNRVSVQTLLTSHLSVFVIGCSFLQSSPQLLALALCSKETVQFQVKWSRTLRHEPLGDAVWSSHICNLCMGGCVKVMWSTFYLVKFRSWWINLSSSSLWDWLYWQAIRVAS